MKTRRSFAALVIGLAVLGPACSTSRVYHDRPAPYRPAYSAYDEGFKRGLMAGGWAGYRDLGKPFRRSYWDDGQYRRGTEGYRVHFGSKIAYADGFRAGYERGYRERRARERRDRRR